MINNNLGGVGNKVFAVDSEENLYVRLIVYCKMFWGLWTGLCTGLCIGFCFMLADWAGWLPLLSFHFISSHVISSPISCHVPLGDELDQCLNVDQSVVSVAKEMRERIKEEGGR